MRSYFIFLGLLLFILINTNNSYSQDNQEYNDSDKVKIGPEELQVTKGPRYFNYADKYKVNIELIVIGGGAPGKYLIPQGTTLFDFLIMIGGTNSRTVEDIKIVRFRSETPMLQGKEVKQYDFSDLYGDKEDLLKSQKNPMLKPADMIILPEIRTAEQSIFYYIRETVAFVGTLVSFYYLIDNLIVRSNR